MEYSTIIKFNKITKIDVQSYLNKAENFFSQDYQNLLKYKLGLQNNIDSKILDNLNNLKKESVSVDSVFITNKNKFNTTDFFELHSIHEEIKVKISTAENLTKWTRSNRLNGTNTGNTSVVKISGKGESLSELFESMTGNVSEEQFNDNQLFNQIRENDWSIVDGEKELKVFTNQISSDNVITTFFDSSLGENIFGKDIQKTISLQDDDLKNLSPQETLVQTVDTLSSLQKGDLFYNKNVGVSKSSIGANINAIEYKRINDDLAETFATDDLFNSISLQNLQYNDGDLLLTIIVSVKLSKEIKINQTI